MNISITLAHSLGMKAVAEGVETAEQLAHLRERHCDQAQGYHLAKPMSSDALMAWYEHAYPSQRFEDFTTEPDFKPLQTALR